MKYIILFLFIFSIDQAHANKLLVTNLKFENQDQLAKLTIQFRGALLKAPELTIKGDILQVSMFNATIWPQISKKISLQKSQDTEIKGYQYDKKTVRVRAILPFALQGMEKRVSLTLKDDSVELHFPNKIYKRQDYDETYLNYLLEQKKQEIQSQDKIQTTQSSVSREDGAIIEEKSFSVMTYIGKYIIFLSAILLGIYGLVLLFKKRVLGKGRLGFLNDIGLVSVLNTVYLGPKRSLLLIKAHDKVLLLGNSEAGLSYLTELSDVSGLLKKGEQEIMGNNFDTTMDVIDQKNTKDEIEEKDSLSNQIKRKVKGLRSLQ